MVWYILANHHQHGNCNLRGAALQQIIPKRTTEEGTAMINIKRQLENRVRGWLPKEPMFSTYPKTAAQKCPPMIRWTARAFLAGAVVSAVLLVAGDLAGL